MPENEDAACFGLLGMRKEKCEEGYRLRKGLTGVRQGLDYRQKKNIKINK